MSLAEQRAAARAAGALVRQEMGAEEVCLWDAKSPGGQKWNFPATVTGAAFRLGGLVEGGMESSGESRARWWKVDPEGESLPVPEVGMLLRVRRLPGRTFEVTEIPDSRDAAEWVVRVVVVE